MNRQNREAPRNLDPDHSRGTQRTQCTLPEWWKSRMTPESPPIEMQMRGSRESRNSHLFPEKECRDPALVDPEIPGEKFHPGIAENVKFQKI